MDKERLINDILNLNADDFEKLIKFAVENGIISSTHPQKFEATAPYHQVAV